MSLNGFEITNVTMNKIITEIAYIDKCSIFLDNDCVANPEAFQPHPAQKYFSFEMDVLHLGQ